MRTDDSIYNKEFDDCRELIENKLDSYFTGQYSYGKLLEAMRYSLLAGGKRIRAVLCIKFCEAAGGNFEKALNAACAIEMLHAYSLIHDDLPAMDDDDLRRGKPSNHIAYGEATAILAGDALQAAAFDALLASELPADTIVEMGKIFAKAAGPHGICGGQLLDLENEGIQIELEQLEEINKYKTAQLISASAIMGVIAAGGTKAQIEAAQEYALSLGLAFQIRDDLLDYIADEKELGKPLLSDKNSNKTTYASLLDLDSCNEIIAKQTKKAVDAIESEFGEIGFLSWLAYMLAERTS